MLLAAMLAMVLVVAVPAIAQVTNTGNSQNDIGQDSEQEAESGEVSQSGEISSSGDNSNQCAGISFVTNTGNVQNQLDLIQYGSTADDFEFDEVGSDLTVTGNPTTTCDQQVNQAAAAG